MTNKKGYRNNFTDTTHIEDIYDSEEEIDIPYDVIEWRNLFPGVPIDNLYWDETENGLYMMDNGKGLMFYFDEDDIYHPVNPAAVVETYYRHLIMWENKQYDLLFPDVPEDFQNNWFKDCASDMPLKMVFAIYSQFKYSQIAQFDENNKNIIGQFKSCNNIYSSG